MRTLRVTLGIRRPLLRDVLQYLLSRPSAGMTIVGDEPEPVALLRSVRTDLPDVVFLDIATAQVSPGVCSHLLAEYPHLKVVMLWPDHYTIADTVVRTQRYPDPLIASIRGSILESLAD